MPVDYQAARRKISEKSVRKKHTHTQLSSCEKSLVILHKKWASLINELTLK